MLSKSPIPVLKGKDITKMGLFSGLQCWTHNSECKARATNYMQLGQTICSPHC